MVLLKHGFVHKHKPYFSACPQKIPQVSGLTMSPVDSELSLAHATFAAALLNVHSPWLLSATYTPWYCQ